VTRPGVEIVAIGTELLLGEVHETNGTWLGKALAAAGIAVRRRIVVGDDAGAIGGAVDEALRRTGVVICTGGLGPTRDDFTRPVVAELLGRALHVDDAWLDTVRRRFEDRGVPMPPSNRVQAEVPEGGILFHNRRGTAPGIAIEDARGLVILLPGVPSEMRGLVEDEVLPYLARRFTDREHPIVSRVLRTTGISESALAERIDDVIDGFAPLTLAFLPAGTGEDLRVTSWGEMDRAQAEHALERAEAVLRERLHPYVYGAGDDDLADVVGGILRANRLTLSVAESCTGGLLAKRLTDSAGASDYFVGGIVSYANAAKREGLGVRAATLDAHGAVSEATVREMAAGSRDAMGSDCALAITGIAGPGGGTPEKPVGTVWVAAAIGTRLEPRRLHLIGDRSEIRARAAQAALDLLRRLLQETDS
jgi:nicotinamide-nucleotide amidase